MRENTGGMISRYLSAISSLTSTSGILVSNISCPNILGTTNIFTSCIASTFWNAGGIDKMALRPQLRNIFVIFAISLLSNWSVGKVLLTSKNDVFGGDLTLPKYKSVDLGGSIYLFFPQLDYVGPGN